MGRISMGLLNAEPVSQPNLDISVPASVANVPSNPSPIVEIKEVYVDRIVEVPVEKIVEVEKLVVKEVIKETFVDRPVEVIREVEKRVEVPFEVIKEVMVDRPVEVLVDKIILKTPSWVAPVLAAQGVIILGLLIWILR